MRFLASSVGDMPGGRRVAGVIGLFFLVWLLPVLGGAAEAPPTAAQATPGGAAMMESAGWLERITMKLESEAMSDVKMLPDTGDALVREWRSLDRNGSALGALFNLGWVVIAALVALAAEKLVAYGLARRLRQAMRMRPQGPRLSGLLLLLVFDAIGLAVFAAVFVYSRHLLLAAGASVALVLLSANVLIRWRISALIIDAILRPREPVARLVDLPDEEARRLGLIMSATLLAIMALVGFGRYGLADEDSGAPHIIGLVVAGTVGLLCAFLVVRARGPAQALFRGCRHEGMLAVLRDGVARAWVPIGLAWVAGECLFFVFGLSLGLLSYFHAFISTSGLVLLLLVFERLGERGWRDSEGAAAAQGGLDPLVMRTFRRMLRAIVLSVAVGALAWLWIAAIEMPGPETARAVMTAITAVATLFVAYIAWELARLAIDRNLQQLPSGPKLPGSDDDEEIAPGSRLQTVLPMLRAGFGVLIAVVATLIVLSHLGIDTAPLIAGAGVFGLAISFGSQSLVRDIISGLFYMWDDAFRLGEYIDTGRLKGTVEALGVRSVKLRHHNGPLHTIPYGQLGAVTNQSRDFATIKFNLRLEPGTDIELVRKTAKRIGVEMQENPEIAAEVILPLKLQGIAEVVDNAVVFRFKFTARPIKPSWIQREYLKRIYTVFAEKGICFASGALTLQTVPARGETDSAASGLEPLLAPATATPATRVA